MRKIIYAQLVSLDGFIEDSEGDIGWTKPDNELHLHFNEMEKNLSINFYGRRMSQAMNYWLTADQNPNASQIEIEYAHAWQSNERYVYSKSLDRVMGNAQIRREIDPEEIRALKNEPGKDMAVGGASLASAFIELGLVDEIRLYIQPVVIGAGKPMFPDSKIVNMDFMESHKFSNGVIMLKYGISSN